jgi:hypothetical protein
MTDYDAIVRAASLILADKPDDQKTRDGSNGSERFAARNLRGKAYGREALRGEYR